MFWHIHFSHVVRHMMRHNVLFVMHHMLLLMMLPHRSQRICARLATLCDSLKNAFVLNVVSGVARVPLGKVITGVTPFLIAHL